MIINRFYCHGLVIAHFLTETKIIKLSKRRKESAQHHNQRLYPVNQHCDGHNRHQKHPCLQTVVIIIKNDLKSQWDTFKKNFKQPLTQHIRHIMI